MAQKGTERSSTCAYSHSCYLTCRIPRRRAAFFTLHRSGACQSRALRGRSAHGRGAVDGNERLALTPRGNRLPPPTLEGEEWRRTVAYAFPPNHNKSTNRFGANRARSASEESPAAGDQAALYRGSPLLLPSDPGSREGKETPLGTVHSFLPTVLSPSLAASTAEPSRISTLSLPHTHTLSPCLSLPSPSESVLLYAPFLYPPPSFDTPPSFDKAHSLQLS